MFEFKAAMKRKIDTRATMLHWPLPLTRSSREHRNDAEKLINDTDHRLHLYADSAVELTSVIEDSDDVEGDDADSVLLVRYFLFMARCAALFRLTLASST